MSKTLKISVLALSFVAAILVEGCGAPSPDGSSTSGQQMLIDQANKALTTSDCATALELLLPVYNSSSSDNAIRLTTASAYGCWATINYFKLLGDIASNYSTFETSGLWGFLAQEFPSKAGSDHVVEGAVLSTTALLSMLKPGIPILPSNEVNAGTYNVGSVYGNDRLSDANIYLLWTSMAAIGGLESRYGNPSSTYHPQTALPWKSATLVTSDGCAFSSSIVNLFDAIKLTSALLPSTVGGYMTALDSNLEQYIDYACDYGCKGTVPAIADHGAVTYAALNATGNWNATGCNFSSGCSPSGGCPASLKNPNSCTASTSDVNSCAAAGIVNLMLNGGAGWF